MCIEELLGIQFMKFLQKCNGYFYRDMCPFNGFKYEYLVRAVKLETTAVEVFIIYLRA